MIIKKRDKETIVFGYGDVVIKGKVSGKTGLLSLYHTTEVYEIGEVAKKGIIPETEREMVNLRFDNAESITVLIDMLKNARKQMKKAHNKREFEYKINWEEMPWVLNYKS